MIKEQVCDICTDTAKHFPVADWKGTAEQYCCHCYTGSNNCDYCDKETEDVVATE